MKKQKKATVTRRPLTPAEWAMAVEQFELGHANCSRLALQFGISRQGMDKGLRKRGAVKASRVSEVIAKLHRVLDQRDREHWQWAADQQRNLESRLTALLAGMGETNAGATVR